MPTETLDALKSPANSQQGKSLSTTMQVSLEKTPSPKQSVQVRLQPWQTLACNLMRNPAPEPPAKLLPDSSSTGKKNCYFKLICLGVIYCAATDNKFKPWEFSPRTKRFFYLGPLRCSHRGKNNSSPLPSINICVNTLTPRLWLGSKL